MSQLKVDEITDEAGTGAPEITDHYKKSNILGTVSESGGVPTGAIIERGSNSNGEFVKFADGTLICTRESNFDTTSTAFVEYDYPANYFGNPSVSMSHQTSNIASAEDSANVVVQRIGTSWRVRTGTAGTSTILITLTAIGRWY